MIDKSNVVRLVRARKESHDHLVIRREYLFSEVEPQNVGKQVGVIGHIRDHTANNDRSG